MTNKLGPYELNTIVTGDARILAEAIPDESVDLIFTDPVYQNIDDYQWLAETAARVLRPNAPCLVWLAKANLVDVLAALDGLNYGWILENHRVGASNFGRSGKLITKLECCLWMEKGISRPTEFVWDYHKSTDWPRFHALGWNKSESCLMRWTQAFSKDNAIIFDPFTGGGTVPAVCKMLGRSYLAFEIDPDVARVARGRVAQTQPPLFVPPQPQQIPIDMLAVKEKSSKGKE